MPNTGDVARQRRVVGVDIGGTKIAAAIVSRDGSCGTVHSVPTEALAGPASVLDRAAGLVRAVISSAGAGVGVGAGAGAGVDPGAGAVTLAGLGVGTAGAVDAGSGTIVSATDTFPGWVGSDIAGGLRARLADVMTDDTIVCVENDVDAHGIGEATFGAGRGGRSTLVVAVGTGVGAAVIIGGSPLRGAHHMAGEIGHMPIPDAAEDLCTCGRPGHLEAVAAGPAIARRYDRLASGSAAANPSTAVAVFDRARSGDEIALQVVADSARATARAVAGLATVIDPDSVVVGGGVLGGGDLWWSTFVATVRAETVEILHDLPLCTAELGGNAPLIGATRAIFTALESEPSA